MEGFVAKTLLLLLRNVDNDNNYCMLVLPQQGPQAEEAS